MGGHLIKAELRKIFSTKLWWGLLIPAAIAAVLANWGGSALARTPELSAAGLRPPLALISLGASMQFTTLFAALYGALAIPGEFRHRTITTTYLTASSRSAVMGAKLLAYLIVSIGYGVIVILFSSLGALLGQSADGFPTLSSWLVVSAGGVLIIALWTLLGVGLGALVTSPVAVVLVLLGYRLIGETIANAALTYGKRPEIVPYLPGNAASGAVTSLAFDRFIADFPPAQQDIDTARGFFGLSHYPAWWVSTLIFAGYAAVVIALGWTSAGQRDIT